MGPPTKLWGFFKKSYPAHNPRDPVLTFDQLPHLDTEIEIVEHRHNRKLGTATIQTKQDRLFRLHRGMYNRGGSHELDAEDYEWLVMDQQIGGGRYPRPKGQAELPTHHFPQPDPDVRPKTVPTEYTFQRDFSKFEDTKAQLHRSANQLKVYNERIKTAEDREKSRISRMSASLSANQQQALEGSQFFQTNEDQDFVAIRPTTAPEFAMKSNHNQTNDYFDHTGFRYGSSKQEQSFDGGQTGKDVQKDKQAAQQSLHVLPANAFIEAQTSTNKSSNRPGTSNTIKPPYIPDLIEKDRVKPGIGLDGVPVLNPQYDQDLEELEKMTILRLHGKESVMNMRQQTLYPIDAISKKRVPVSHMELVQFRGTRPYGFAMEVKAKKRKEAKEKVQEFIRSNTTGANKARGKTNTNGSKSNAMLRSQTAPSNQKTPSTTTAATNAATMSRSGSALLKASLSNANLTSSANGSPGNGNSPNLNTASNRGMRPLSGKSRPLSGKSRDSNAMDMPWGFSSDSFDNRDFNSIYEKNLQEVMSFDESDMVQDNIHAIVLRGEPSKMNLFASYKNLEPVFESGGANASPTKSPAVPKISDFPSPSPSSPFLTENRPMSARRHKQSTPFIVDIPYNIDLLKQSLTESLPVINITGTTMTNNLSETATSSSYPFTSSQQSDEQAAQKKLSLEIPTNLEELVAGQDQPFQAVEERAVSEDFITPMKRDSMNLLGSSTGGYVLATRSSSFLMGNQVSVPHAIPTHHVTESTTSSHAHPVLSRAGSSSYMLMRINSNRTMPTRNNSMQVTSTNNSPIKSNQSPLRANVANNGNSPDMNIPPVAFTFDAVGHIKDIHFKSQLPKARPSSADRLHRKKREVTPAEEAERHRMILEEEERKATLQSNRKDLYNLHMIDEIDAHNERHALTELYRLCGGKNWIRQDNWNTNRPVRDWYGVNLTVEGYVFELHLSNNNLSGPFPDILCDFPKLEVVQLDNNQLTGVLPDYCLQNCRSLRILSVRNNHMSGLLPFDLLTDLIFLQELWLSQNHFHGPLQIGISKLKSLTHLCMKDNQLTGEIPSQLSKLKHLKYLSLGKNKFTGSIPKSFISLHNLETLSVFTNQLSGPVPEWIFSIPTLEEIELFDNPNLIIPEKLPMKVS